MAWQHFAGHISVFDDAQSIHFCNMLSLRSEEANRSSLCWCQLHHLLCLCFSLLHRCQTSLAPSRIWMRRSTTCRSSSTSLNSTKLLVCFCFSFCWAVCMHACLWCVCVCVCVCVRAFGCVGVAVCLYVSVVSGLKQSANMSRIMCTFQAVVVVVVGCVYFKWTQMKIHTGPKAENVHIFLLAGCVLLFLDISPHQYRLSLFKIFQN